MDAASAVGPFPLCLGDTFTGAEIALGARRIHQCARGWGLAVERQLASSALTQVLYFLNTRQILGGGVEVSASNREASLRPGRVCLGIPPTTNGQNIQTLKVAGLQG